MLQPTELQASQSRQEMAGGWVQAHGTRACLHQSASPRSSRTQKTDQRKLAGSCQRAGLMLRGTAMARKACWAHGPSVLNAWSR